MRNKIQALAEIVFGTLAILFFFCSIVFSSNHAWHEQNLDKQTFQVIILGFVCACMIPSLLSILKGIKMRYLFLIGKKWSF